MHPFIRSLNQHVRSLFPNAVLVCNDQYTYTITHSVHFIYKDDYLKIYEIPKSKTTLIPYADPDLYEKIRQVTFQYHFKTIDKWKKPSPNSSSSLSKS